MAAIISRAIIKLFKGIFYLCKSPKKDVKENTSEEIEKPVEEISQ